MRNIKIISLLLSVIMLSLTLCTTPFAITLGDDSNNYEDDNGSYENVMAPEIAKDVRAWVDENKTSYDNLKGLTVNILGDSYLGGQYLGSQALSSTADYAKWDSIAKNYLVWPALLAYKHGWDYTNNAQNGAPVSTATGITYADNMVNNLEKMPSNSPDIVIFDGGRNDFNKNVTLGTIDSRDTATYMGALNEIIDGLKEKYPNAILIYTTVWNFSGTNGIGLSYMDYALAAIRVCNTRGVHVFNAYNKDYSGVDMSSQAFRAQYCIASDDVSHLNIEGMKLVMPVYERFISETLTRVKAEQDSNSDNENESESDSAPIPEEESESNVESETDSVTAPSESESQAPTSPDSNDKDTAPIGTIIAVTVIIIAAAAIVASAVILTVALIKKKKNK